jgi:hypothetical protein
MIPFSQNLNFPIRGKSVRFAVGPPDGITSNSWKCWVENSGVYICCRDNFREAKISLHTRGQWRMGFTSEAIKKNPALVRANQNRAWRVWKEPPAQLPDTVLAFRLVFPTPELAVNPAQRAPKEWEKVIFIEAGPAGKMVVASLFVTMGDINLKHESEPSLWLASLEMADGRRAQLIIHGEPNGEFPEIIDRGIKQGIAQVDQAGVKLLLGAYAYFLGESPEGWRYLVGARANR